MRLTIQLNPSQQPDLVGEILRNEFFDQSNNEMGCYTTFNLAEDVVINDPHLVPVDIEYPEDLKWKCYFKYFIDEGGNINKIIMGYYWDGDGTLVFKFPDDSWLINSDCKKDFRWEFFWEECPI